RVVVGDRASAHWRGQEGNAERDEPLQRRGGIRPGGALPDEHQRPCGSGDHVRDRGHADGIGVGLVYGRSRAAPLDVVLGDVRGEEGAGKVEVDAAGAPADRFAKSKVEKLWYALWRIDLDRPLAGRRRVGNLV